MISIQAASLEHLPLLVAFNQSLAYESEGYQLDALILEQGVRAVLEDANKGFYLVAKSSDTVIGCLMITYEWSDWRNTRMWWLQSVFVAPAHRGQGVFATLLKQVEELAKEQEIQLLRLYMEKDNAKGAAAYSKNGFHKTAYWIYEKGLTPENS
jgi:GNAT superfamily N-acetyltransferase